MKKYRIFRLHLLVIQQILNNLKKMGELYHKASSLLRFIMAARIQTNAHAKGCRDQCRHREKEVRNTHSWSPSTVPSAWKLSIRAFQLGPLDPCYRDRNGCYCRHKLSGLYYTQRTVDNSPGRLPSQSRDGATEEGTTSTETSQTNPKMGFHLSQQEYHRVGSASRNTIGIIWLVRHNLNIYSRPSRLGEHVPANHLVYGFVFWFLSYLIAIVFVLVEKLSWVFAFWKWGMWMVRLCTILLPPTEVRRLTCCKSYYS